MWKSVLGEYIACNHDIVLLIGVFSNDDSDDDFLIPFPSNTRLNQPTQNENPDSTGAERRSREAEERRLRGDLTKRFGRDHTWRSSRDAEIRSRRGSMRISEPNRLISEILHSHSIVMVRPK